MTATDSSPAEGPQRISTEYMEAEKDAFNATYGKALGAWSILEFMLQRLFTRMTGLSPEMSAALFYSARSFNGRADMIEAIIPLVAAPDDFKKTLARLLKKIRQYSGTRNRLAHAQQSSSTKLSDAGDKYIISCFLCEGDKLDSPDENGRMLKDHLGNCRINFGRLAYYVLYTWKVHDPDTATWPQRCHELILQLPNDPCSTAIAPIPSAPELPPEP